MITKERQKKRSSLATSSIRPWSYLSYALLYEFCLVKSFTTSEFAKFTGRDILDVREKLNRLVKKRESLPAQIYEIAYRSLTGDYINIKKEKREALKDATS